MGGGWVNGRGVGDGGGVVKLTIKTQTAAVCPVIGTNSHNPQDRPRQSLATV